MTDAHEIARGLSDLPFRLFAVHGLADEVGMMAARSLVHPVVHFSREFRPQIYAAAQFGSKGIQRGQRIVFGMVQGDRFSDSGLGLVGANIEPFRADMLFPQKPVGVALSGQSNALPNRPLSRNEQPLARLP